MIPGVVDDSISYFQHTIFTISYHVCNAWYLQYYFELTDKDVTMEEFKKKYTYIVTFVSKKHTRRFSPKSIHIDARRFKHFEKNSYSVTPDLFAFIDILYDAAHCHEEALLRNNLSAILIIYRLVEKLNL